jgi:hypothetical protein
MSLFDADVEFVKKRRVHLTTSSWFCLCCSCDTQWWASHYALMMFLRSRRIFSTVFVGGITLQIFEAQFCSATDDLGCVDLKYRLLKSPMSHRKPHNMT